MCVWLHILFLLKLGGGNLRWGYPMGFRMGYIQDLAVVQVELAFNLSGSDGPAGSRGVRALSMRMPVQPAALLLDLLDF